MTAIPSGSTYGATPRGFSLARAISGTMAELRARYADFLEEQRIRKELECYSDHELAELGLSRGDIADVAAGRYGRDF